MGLFTTGGPAGRGPGRGKTRGFGGWGKSTGGTGRDRPPERWTRQARGKAERGPTRGFTRNGRDRGSPRGWFG